MNTWSRNTIRSLLTAFLLVAPTLPEALAQEVYPWTNVVKALGIQPE